MNVRARNYRAPNQLSEERENELLEAAVDVFIEKGIGGATMDQIAKRAGVSKVTLYRRYDDKFQLFERVIRRAANIRAQHLANNPLDINDPIGSLRAMGKTVADVYSADRHLEISRLIVAEANRLPEICHWARNTMVTSMVSDLVNFLTQLKEMKLISHDNVHEAAVSFVLLFSQGFRPYFNAMGDEAQQQRQFESDFAIFCRGIGLLN